MVFCCASATWRQAVARAISTALVRVVAAGVVHGGAGYLANFIITEKPIFEESVAAKGVDIGYLSVYKDSGYSLPQPSTFVWSESTNYRGFGVAKAKNGQFLDVARTNNRFWKDGERGQDRLAEVVNK
jgi:hypothetical protein